MNAKDLQALTLAGPTRENLLYSPLTVLSLYNGLYINKLKYLKMLFNREVAQFDAEMVKLGPNPGGDI